MTSVLFSGGPRVISTTGEYALRAAVHLARHFPVPQTTRVIAEGAGVPTGYLSKILQAMVRSRMITSQRGLHGGFVLAREAGTVSVLDVLGSVDAAPHRITKCPLGIPAHEELCPLHHLVDAALAQAMGVFSNTMLRDLCCEAEAGGDNRTGHGGMQGKPAPAHGSHPTRLREKRMHH